jgi:hydroxyacylglutathione hydrolase
MLVRAVPALSDNYVWIVVNPSTRDALVVDPGEAAPVLAALADLGALPRSVLLTHHHGDHVGGVPELTQAYPGLEVIASTVDRERLTHATRGVHDGEVLERIGTSVRCLTVPGHTRGAVAYHLPALGAVFTGDTLFTCGCGRLFEGTPAQMLASLERLAALPPETLIYCGHEYTEKNVRFALTLEPEHEGLRARLARVVSLRQAGEPTVPAPLALELSTNPFLRARDRTLQARLDTTDALATFTEVRQRRNAY